MTEVCTYRVSGGAKRRCPKLSFEEETEEQKTSMSRWHFNQVLNTESAVDEGERQSG